MIPQTTLPRSRVDVFLQSRRPKDGRRLGQAFYDFMQADKCVSDKDWWDALYNASDRAALSMILDRVDWHN